MPHAIWGHEKEFVCPIQNGVIPTRERTIGALMIFLRLRLLPNAPTVMK